MKEKRNLHLKVQEMCNCYASTDPLKSMSQMVKDIDTEEAAVKWLALAALHGINANAKKIAITQSGDDVKVVAEYRKTELPAPGSAIAENVIAVAREILHLTESKGKMPLSLGIRDSSINIQVKVKSKGDHHTLSLKFDE